MIGIGTLLNTGAIILAGVVGVVFKKFLKERYQDSILKISGMAVLMLGLSGSLAKMLVTGENGNIAVNGAMLMVLSLVLGTIVGEIIDIDGKFEKFGLWLKRTTGNAKDSQFVDAFVTASLTVSIGAMAIIGSIEDGISGDYSTLAAKSLLDFFIIAIMCASMGKGCAFSAIPVFLFQGSITLLAAFIGPFMSDAVLLNISLVGNILIACVGINLIRPGTFKVANFLPAILFAVAFTFVPLVANA